MTLLFFDLNVWLALSDVGNSHNAAAWAWLNRLPDDARLIFSRYTQIGLLRLLTNTAVMGDQTLTLGEAWAVYDRWLADPRVEFHPESRTLEAEFRKATKPFADRQASKWVGDCLLLAFAQSVNAQLVTFDKALHEFAHKQGNSAILPAGRFVSQGRVFHLHLEAMSSLNAERDPSTNEPQTPCRPSFFSLCPKAKPPAFAPLPNLSLRSFSSIALSCRPTQPYVTLHRFVLHPLASKLE